MANLSEVSAISHQFLDHAKRCLPNEGCGLVTKVGDVLKYIEVENISEAPNRSFLIDPAVYEEYRDTVAYVVHSHVNRSPKPTNADILCSEKVNIPFVIVSLPSEEIACYYPTGARQDLVGRDFIYPMNDCYAIVKDYYKYELGVDIADYDRKKWGWWEDSKNRDYLETNAKSEGFFKVDVKDLKAGDLIFMQLGADIVNHIAVYLGGNVILHQVLEKKSSKEIYGSYWKKNTMFCMRHKNVR